MLLHCITFVCILLQQIDSIMATLAAILHLTDIEFKEDDESRADGVLIKNEDSLEMGDYISMYSLSVYKGLVHKLKW